MNDNSELSHAILRLLKAMKAKKSLWGEFDGDDDEARAKKEVADAAVNVDTTLDKIIDAKIQASTK